MVRVGFGGIELIDGFPSSHIFVTYSVYIPQ